MNKSNLVTDAAYPRLPYHIKHSAINDWQIDKNVQHIWFDRYYLLHWQGIYLFEQVNNGTLRHDGTLFKLNWITVPSLCYNADQVALSFRRIFGQDEGYVLVKTLS